MGNEAIFHFLQTFMGGDGNYIFFQASVICGRGFASQRLPGVQTNVVMVATGADEKGSWELRGNIEA